MANIQTQYHCTSCGNTFSKYTNDYASVYADCPSCGNQSVHWESSCINYGDAWYEYDVVTESVGRMLI